jgi:hypothetical protein
MNFKSKILALVALTTSTNINAAIIINGSFEDDASTGWYIPSGWTWSTTFSPQILDISPPNNIDGSYYIEIGNDNLGNPVFGTLSQTINELIIGHEYELSFLWGNRTGLYDFTVEMGGTTFNQSGSGTLDFTAAAFTFVAATSIEDLNITWNDPGTPTPGSDGTMDAFALNDLTVPVPAAVWLFASGLFGLLAVARRKACI